MAAGPAPRGGQGDRIVITILASPKPFVGVASTHQMNAIRSWLALAPGVEVILFDDAPGTAEAARRLGVKHVPEVERSPRGVPYFGAIAAYAERNGRYETQAYLNCDLVATGTLLAMIARVPFRQFLMVGQRIDLPRDLTIDVTGSAWEDRLLELAEKGRIDLSAHHACDYFVFRRGLWQTLPPAVIGRAGYDNALIAHCLRGRVPVIDATRDVMVLHPFHGYDHVAGGKDTVWMGEDARLNLASIGNCPAPGTWDATWRCKDGRFTRARGHGDWLRALEIHARLVWRSQALGLAFGLLGRWGRRVGISRPRPVKVGPVVYRLLRDARSRA